MTPRPLLERLHAGETVLCAEGYLFDLERRGWLSPAAYVPEVLLTHPEVVAETHRDMVRAGSDVVEAFTFYAHREKLRQAGIDVSLARELNHTALALARTIAEEHDALLAGNICNTNLYADDAQHPEIRAMFEEQVGWAAEHDVDYVVGETFVWGGEAVLAAETIRAAERTGVVTVGIMRSGLTREGWTPAEACRRIEQAGADVVGLNCLRGPATMLPLLPALIDAVSCPVAALPVPYRTDDAHPTHQSFTAPDEYGREVQAFPDGLDRRLCSRHDTARFARDATGLGVGYLGLCCGAGPHHVRSMAQALGRTPPGAHYTVDAAVYSASADQAPDILM